ncbi:MAG: DUF72 domain-containing protein [Elainella sp.]
MTFWLGCAIWAYKDWVGELFPLGSRASQFLALYSRRFTAVEGNTTFYSVPTAATVQRWATETPSGFKFCPKLPRTLTHQGSLTDAIPDTIAFLERMQGLGDRLGPVFAQLPPSYGPNQLNDLAAFLAAVSAQTTLAVEVRHPGWFRPESAQLLNDLLTDLGVGRVLLDTRPIYHCPDDPQLASERRKPKLPLQPVTTAPFNLVRYISHPDPQYNRPYLQTWAGQVLDWLQQGQQVYFFVHCPVEQHSPGTARQFYHLLAQQLLTLSQPIGLPPLPWDQVDRATEPDLPEAATQLTLF